MEPGRYEHRRPPNAHITHPDVCLDWGVWDKEQGKFVGSNNFTEAFARILASGMNLAYVRGIQAGRDNK